MISKVKSLLLLFVIGIGSNLLASKPSGPHIIYAANPGNGGGSKQTGTHANFKEHQTGYRAPEVPSATQAPSLTPAQSKDIADGYGIGIPRSQYPTANTQGTTAPVVHTPGQLGTGASDNVVLDPAASPNAVILSVGGNSRQGTATPTSGGNNPSAPAAPKNPTQPQSGLSSPQFNDGPDYYHEFSFGDPDSESTSHRAGDVEDDPFLRKVYYDRPTEEPNASNPQSKPEAPQAKPGDGKIKSESSSAASSSSDSAAAGAGAGAASVRQSNRSDEDSRNDNEVTDSAKQEYEMAEYQSRKKETEHIYNYVLYLPSYSHQDFTRDIESLSKRIDQVKLEYLSLSGGIPIPTAERRLLLAQARLAAADKLSHLNRVAAYKNEAQLRAKESEYATLQTSLGACSKAHEENKKLFEEQFNTEETKKEKKLKDSSYAFWEFEADKQIANYRKSLVDCEKEIKNLREQYAQILGKLNAYNLHHPVKRGWAVVKGMLWKSENYKTLDKDIEKLRDKLAERQSESAALKNKILILQRLKSDEERASSAGKFSAAYESALNSFAAGQGQDKELGENSVHNQLTANQKHLILHSNLDIAIFERSRNGDNQNYIFKRLNESLAIAAEAQAKGANAQKIDPYNHAVAILCAMSHTHHQQGRIDDAQKACGLAQAIAQTISANNHAPNSDIANIVQDIENYVSEAIQNIRDNNFLTTLKDKWIEFKNTQNANTQKEVSLLLGIMSAGTVPASSGANLGTGTLSIAFEAILADQVATMGAVSAAAAVDPRPPLFRAIDEALKPVEQMSANGKNQGAGNKDKNTGSAGESKSQEHQHGTYEDAGYHHANSKGGKNPPPQNGQKALDNSILIKNTSPNRVAVEGDNFVMLRETRGGPIPEFHGNLQTWQELSQDAQTALREAGICNHKGKILRRIG